MVRTDLSVQEDLGRLIAAALDRRGHVDILVNNAAYTVGKALWAHVPELTREQWDKGFVINVTAPLMLISGFWDSMRQRGGGRVINVTSGASELQPLETTTRLEGSTLPDNGPLYGASKAALNRMANVIAHEGFPHRIAVMNVEPGFVLTEIMEQTFRPTRCSRGRRARHLVDDSGEGDHPPVHLRGLDALQRPGDQRARAGSRPRAVTSVGRDVLGSSRSMRPTVSMPRPEPSHARIPTNGRHRGVRRNMR